jgi:hypothetical protein
MPKYANRFPVAEMGHWQLANDHRLEADGT